MEIASPFQGSDGCWEWPLSRNKETGYGQFMVSTSPAKLQTVHRFSYELFVGDIPAGRYVLHHCDTRPCFRPSHLFVGSAQDNVDDMFRKGRNQDYTRRKNK